MEMEILKVQHVRIGHMFASYSKPTGLLQK